MDETFIFPYGARSRMNSAQFTIVFPFPAPMLLDLLKEERW